MKTKLLTICLILFTSQVSAENEFTWELISTSVVGGSKVYADKNSIRKNNSGNYVVWVLLNLNQGEFAGQSSIMSEEHDCTRLRYRWLYVERYSKHYGKGEVKEFDTEQLKSSGYYKWTYPKPNSNAYHTINWVCKNID